MEGEPEHTMSVVAVTSNLVPTMYTQYMNKNNTYKWEKGRKGRGTYIWGERGRETEKGEREGERREKGEREGERRAKIYCVDVAVLKCEDARTSLPKLLLCPQLVEERLVQAAL